MRGGSEYESKRGEINKKKKKKYYLYQRLRLLILNYTS
jgi:hypothetical protein